MKASSTMAAGVALAKLSKASRNFLAIGFWRVARIGNFQKIHVNDFRFQICLLFLRNARKKF
jgi:hypothetical protein